MREGSIAAAPPTDEVDVVEASGGGVGGGVVRSLVRGTGGGDGGVQRCRRSHGGGARRVFAWDSGGIVASYRITFGKKGVESFGPICFLG
jgi:hypothetical protein